MSIPTYDELENKIKMHEADIKEKDKEKSKIKVELKNLKKALKESSVSSQRSPSLQNEIDLKKQIDYLEKQIDYLEIDKQDLRTDKEELRKQQTLILGNFFVFNKFCMHNHFKILIF